MQASLDGLRAKILVNKQLIFCLSFIVLLGLLSLTWFRGDFFLVSLDSNFPLNATSTASHFGFIWDATAPPGTPVGRSIPYFFYQGFLGLIQETGFPMYDAQKLEFSISFVFSGLAMFFLMQTILKGKHKNATSLISALFYMFNPFTMLWIWHDHLPEMFFYATIPLLLAFFIKGIQKKQILRYTLLFCAFSFLISSAFGNPVDAVMMWLILVSFLFYYLLSHFRETDEIRFSLKFFIVLVFAWSALNLWWLLPSIYSLPGEAGVLQAVNAGATSYDKLLTSSLDSTLINSYRLQGIWSFSPVFGGTKVYPFVPIFHTPIFVLISFLIPLTVFIPFLSKKQESSMLFFGITAAISLLGMTALQAPAGPVFNWLFNNLPGFVIFRDPYYRFGLIVSLCYAPLFGFGVEKIYVFVKRVFRKKAIATVSAGVLCFLVIGAFAWPLWTGDFIGSGTDWTPDAYVKVPSYYQDADRWLRSQSDDFRLLTMPLSTVFYAAYNWTNGYMGMDPSPWLFSKPTINRDSGDSYSLALKVANDIVQNSSTDEIAGTLTLLNVKYIVLHRDADESYIAFNPSWFVAAPIDVMEETLNSTPNIRLERSFGSLEFYRNELYDPVGVYAASDSILVDGGLSDMAVLLNDWHINLHATALFSTKQVSFPPIEFNNAVFQNHDLTDMIVDMNAGSIQIPISHKDTASDDLNYSEVTFTANVAQSQTYDVWAHFSGYYDNAHLTLVIDNKTADVEKIAPNYLQEESWVKLTSVLIDGGQHNFKLISEKGSILPDKAVIASNTSVNSAANKTASYLDTYCQHTAITFQPFAGSVDAWSYAGWNGAVSFTGEGDPDMLVFPQNQTPYSIPSNKLFQGRLNTFNSTILYIVTGSSPLTVNTILADGKEPPWIATLDPISVLWATGYMGLGNSSIEFPFTLPANQRAIIILTGYIAKNVELKTNNGDIYIDVFRGDSDHFNFSQTTTATTGVAFIAKGQYTLLGQKSDRLETENVSVQIDGIHYFLTRAGNDSYASASDITIESGFHAISIPSELTKFVAISDFTVAPKTDFTNIFYTEKNSEVIYTQINPTLYQLKVKSPTSSLVVLSQSYNPDWELLIGEKSWIQTLGAKPLLESQHLIANGYANAWIVSEGTADATIYFQPQNLFYFGLALSLASVLIILCLLVYFFQRKKSKFQLKEGAQLGNNREEEFGRLVNTRLLTFSIFGVWAAAILLAFSAVVLISGFNDLAINTAIVSWVFLFSSLPSAAD